MFVPNSIRSRPFRRKRRVAGLASNVLMPKRRDISSPAVFTVRVLRTGFSGVQQSLSQSKPESGIASTISRSSPGASSLPCSTLTVSEPTAASSFADTASAEPFCTVARTLTTPASRSARVSSRLTAGQPERRSVTESVMPW